MMRGSATETENRAPGLVLAFDVELSWRLRLLVHVQIGSAGMSYIRRDVGLRDVLWGWECKLAWMALARDPI